MSDHYEMLVGDLQDQIAELERENKRMREALKQIAGDENGYGDPDIAVDCLKELKEGE